MSPKQKDIHTAKIFSKIHPQLNNLKNHPIYSAISTLEDLRIFMTWHVFAVWDFMSLLKSLQRHLTCLDIPWVSPNNATSARLINEIVLNEETDIDADGSPTSHLALYLEAMKEIGAPRDPFETFIAAIENKKSLTESLDISRAPYFVSNFVKFTINCAQNAQLPELASAFVFGRETLVPDMFNAILVDWGIGELSAPRMHYYLSRHIEIDGNQHGPASIRLLENTINDSSENFQAAALYAIKSVNMRISLWDGLHELIGANNN